MTAYLNLESRAALQFGKRTFMPKITYREISAALRYNVELPTLIANSSRESTLRYVEDVTVGRDYCEIFQRPGDDLILILKALHVRQIHHSLT